MIESDILNWQKMFVEQTTRMNEEGERQAKSATPYPRPQKDAYKAINRYEQQSAKIAISSSQAEFELRQNFISNKEHFCSKKLEDLVPIKLKEMHVNKIHTGRFLLCRVIRDPFYITGTLVLIQDSDNQVENLSLYNFSSSYKIDAKLLLPNNSIIIIKEPFLKNMLSSPTDFHIRVESPTDLIILSNLDKDDKNAQYFLDKWTDIKDSDRSLSFDELNKKGNVFFVGKNYHSAIRYYTKALNLAREDKTVNNSDVKKTLNNRAAALLKLDKYFQAYQDTVKSTQIENVNDTRDVANNEKAFYRMGKAAYSMRQFDVALEAFEKCLALNVKNKDAGEEVIRSKKRLAERSTGKYDMKSVIEHALVQKQPRLDLADFVSDDIEIRNVNNNPNYKGLYVTILFFI
jgi:tetratricopeptide (TPR) repeat protein